jgi:hypothetical protein
VPSLFFFWVAMTAGQDDEGLDSKDYRALRKAIRSTGKNVVVHALAFTSFHDFEFLNTIRRDLGTEEGGFQVPPAGTTRPASKR